MREQIGYRDVSLTENIFCRLQQSQPTCHFLKVIKGSVYGLLQSFLIEDPLVAHKRKPMVPHFAHLSKSIHMSDFNTWVST